MKVGNQIETLENKANLATTDKICKAYVDTKDFRILYITRSAKSYPFTSQLLL